MRPRTQYLVRCLFSGWLFFFAATADFISTSVISGGYHANNPPVRIEHKCAGHAGRVSARSQSSASQVDSAGHSSRPALVWASHFHGGPAMDSPRMPFAGELPIFPPSTPFLPPLRC